MGASAVPTVLWSGVDTLEVSYAGGTYPAWAEHLDRAKKEAQKRDCPTAVRVAGEICGCSRSGLKPWAWVLRSADYHVRVGRGRAGHSVRCLSMGLAAHGAVAVLDRAERVLRAMGEISNARCSRIDVAIDFQGWEPGIAQMVAAVCPASFRPIYPSVSAPETFQFGRGDLVGRVYNKTREIKQGSHWPGVWKNHPDYDPDQDVWRVEFQYRKDALRDRGIVTPGDALGCIGDLAATGFRWLSVREPSGFGDDNRHKAPVAAPWAALADGFREFQPLLRCIDAQASTSAHALVPMVSGCLVSIGAHLGMLNPLDVAAWVVRAMGERHAESGYEFADLVHDRQRSIYGVSTLDGLEPGYAYNGLS